MVGIIVSGGANNQVLKSVEIIREDGTICTLPDMQVNRGSHTQAGWVICGGADDAAQNTCTTLHAIIAPATWNSWIKQVSPKDYSL